MYGQLHFGPYARTFTLTYACVLKSVVHVYAAPECLCTDTCGQIYLHMYIFIDNSARVDTAIHMGVSKSQRPQCRPQYTVILMIRTSTTERLIVGTSHIPNEP